GGELRRVALATDEVNGFLAHSSTACRCRLGRPYVRALALTRGHQDGEAAVFGLHDAFRLEKIPEVQYAPGERRAMQEHAERPTDLSEPLQHAIDNVMVFGRHIGLASNRGDSCHDDWLLSVRESAHAERRHCKPYHMGLQVGISPTPALTESRAVSILVFV